MSWLVKENNVVMRFIFQWELETTLRLETILKIKFMEKILHSYKLNMLFNKKWDHLQRQPELSHQPDQVFVRRVPEQELSGFAVV